MRPIMGSRHRILWISAAATVLTVSLASQEDSRRSRGIPERVSEMQHHFVDVTLVHEAVIRGDLPATLQPAARLATLAPPPLMADASAQFIESIRLAGRRIVQQRTLATAAGEVTTMLRQCGLCHQAMSVFPVRRTPSGPDVGGVVGHMLQHQRALDDLLLGLVMPSETQWHEGAARLKTAVLRPADWPPSPDLTGDVRRAEKTVHDIADEAARATTTLEQARIYARLLRACGSCHSLHARIWGPRSR